jgi:RNA polymerase sigma-70 factor (ECF subfamily)
MDTVIERLLALDSRLRRAALRIATDAQEADDLMQELWLAALTQGPGAQRALQPWALAVLRNQAARRARSVQQELDGLELDQLEGAALDGEPLVEHRDVASHLRECIESLPEPYRATLIELFYQARSVSEIASSSRTPRATVSTHLQRALQRLRARLSRARDLLGCLPGWGLRRPKHAAARVSSGGGV